MKYSRQRKLILDIVKANHVHPTAEWVYEEARKRIPGIGIATVYRNLNMLASMGEIKKIACEGGVDRFDGDCSEHYHLKCSKCGKLYDLEIKDEAACKNLLPMIQAAFSLEAAELNLNPALVQGVCSCCSSECE